MSNRHSETLADFVQYCEAYPEERFWQALLNWSEAEFILAVGVKNYTCYKDTGHIQIKNHDTFYREGK